MNKRVLIIGAGASGLTAIKCCLEENIDPVCYERSPDIGGVWRYEESEKNGACVYKSTIINTSKEMMCFSDFPIPKEFPNYMHNTKVMEYFRMYSKEFNLDHYITFNTEVNSCQVADNYEETGRWTVKSRTLNSSETKTETFDGVIVAVGHHEKPNLPLETFAGINNFNGKYLHSHSYRHLRGYEDQNILVVGIGNSGVDISVELSRVGKQVILSTRRGCWLINRNGDYGAPSDINLITRFNSWLLAVLPFYIFNTFFEIMLNKRIDHEAYGLRPNHRALSAHPTINDDLPSRVLSGMLKIKGNVKCFTEDGVVFEDDEFQPIDVVIFATGYSFSFPFLDKSLIEHGTNNIQLYKYIFPPGLKKSTLAFVGGIQPLGAVNPISELQSRWITRVFKGISKLPTQKEMEKDIKVKQDEMHQRYYKSSRHSVQVDYVPYMDEIAMQIGVRPNAFSFLLSDPKLAYKMLFEGCTSYQFRLTGPGKWSKARDMIMTQNKRVMHPLKTRPTVVRTKSHFKEVIVV